MYSTLDTLSIPHFVCVRQSKIDERMYVRTMKDTIITQELPYLLTREQASKFLGIDPKSFDKFIRANDDLERFMIGRQERYTVSSLSTFVKTHSI